MELALSLGDRHTGKPFSLVDKSQKILGKELGFCMAAGTSKPEPGQDPPVQLDLLPFSPVQRTHPSSSNLPPFPWLHQNCQLEDDQGMDLEAAGTPNSSPNSAASSLQMEFSIFRSRNKRDFDQMAAAANSSNVNGGEFDRGSDEELDQNGLARKKLRLSKEQSAYLEESFKEHSTLNPKQKVALAKQLNLRPRQVEVWFQNRRARTKLKQTEVDCEYLKRCCETLTEENRRLQKEVQELRTLKASQPFYMHLPATTLTMCPSCERVVTTTRTTMDTPPSASKLLPVSPPSQQAAACD